MTGQDQQRPDFLDHNLVQGKAEFAMGIPLRVLDKVTQHGQQDFQPPMHFKVVQ